MKPLPKWGMGGLAVLGVAAFIGLNGLFTVNERESALVFRFGQFQAAHTDPGLKFKVPFVDEVTRYPAQVVQVSLQPEPIKLADKKVLNVDSYGYWRISDPLRFFLRLRTVEQANKNLADRINSTTRNVLGRYTMTRVLSEERGAIMQQIMQTMKPDMDELGIQLVDVRIHRAELPDETRDALYNRMVSERQRIAKEIRAQGDEEAQQIRAKAERERTIMIAEAEQNAQTVRGQGDAQASKIYADAFGSDPEFYSFYRSLQAYRTALKPEDTTLVLSPDSAFFKYFHQRRGAE